MNPISQCAGSVKCSSWIGFAWGFLEATVFFVVPDVWIAWSIMHAKKAGFASYASSIAGSLLGALLLFLVVPLIGLNFFASIPGISLAMIGNTASLVREAGLPFSPIFVLKGVPFKVYAATYLVGGGGLAHLLAWTVYARIVRIAPTAVIALLLRPIVARIKMNESVLLILYGCFWALFYAWYWSGI
ncbi:MAG TPA: hypothetical protein VMH91_02150 [Candidatus Paceibacterota bacterium]|nr:hypothetical protein [Candidatus Paceibacterota bacterium]